MKLLLFIVMIFTYFSSYGQITDSLTTQSKAEKYDFYFSKHKKQKKTGLILLGSGIVATGTGLLIAANSGVFDDSDDLAAGMGLFFVGSLTTISSIPVLISSGVNKRKAAAYVQIGDYQLIESTVPDSKIVAVGFKIEF